VARQGDRDRDRDQQEADGEVDGLVAEEDGGELAQDGARSSGGTRPPSSSPEPSTTTKSAWRGTDSRPYRKAYSTNETHWNET
jgi:hypothetical protein